MSQIIPLENKILVEQFDDSLKSDVRRTETEEKKRPQKGRVLAVGKTYEGILKKGDIVYFQKYNVEELEIDKRKFYVGIPEDFLVKVITKSK